MFYELVRLAVGNLGRARGRLVMTAGGVLVGTAAVILLIALTIGLQNAAEAGIGQSGSLTELNVWPRYGYSPDGTPLENIPQLNVEAVRDLWQIEGVAAVIPFVSVYNFQMMVEDEELIGYGQIYGVDPRLLPHLGVTFEQGTPELGGMKVIAGGRVGEQFYPMEPPEDSDGMMMPSLVDMMNTPVELSVYQNTPDGSFEERRLQLEVTSVMAIANSQYDSVLLMDINDAIRLNDWINGTEFDPETFVFEQVMVRATSRETTNQVSDAIRELGFEAGGMGDFLNQLNQFFGTMRLMLGGVGGVALLVAAFGVANTMTMAILERTKEIGLMKAIGATDRDVLTVFLLEASLVGFCGGMSGVGVAMVLQNAINSALANAPTDPSGGGAMFLPIDPAQLNGNLMVIPPELSLFAITLATIVGLLAGTLPALRAARMPPVLALKSE